MENQEEKAPDEQLNKLTGKPLCLLLNFGNPRVDIKRFRGSRC